VAERPTTTIAPQALLLMNNPNVHNYAKAFAKRIAGDRGKSLEEVVRSGYLIALARSPAFDELKEGVSFIQQQTDSYQSAGKSNAHELAVDDFCQILMCLNEFVYVD